MKESKAIDLIALQQKLRKIPGSALAQTWVIFKEITNQSFQLLFARFNVKIVLNAISKFCTFISLPEWNPGDSPVLNLRRSEI